MGTDSILRVETTHEQLIYNPIILKRRFQGIGKKSQQFFADLQRIKYFFKQQCAHVVVSVLKFFWRDKWPRRKQQNSLKGQGNARPYSRVPNTRVGLLFFFESFSFLCILIQNYTLIKFREIIQPTHLFGPTLLLFFPSDIIIETIQKLQFQKV